MLETSGEPSIFYYNDELVNAGLLFPDRLSAPSIESNSKELAKRIAAAQEPSIDAPSANAFNG